MALSGTGLAFDNVTVNSNNGDLTNPNSAGFAYFLYNSVGVAANTLDNVSLNGDASGPVTGTNNLVAQWNMSPEGNQPAAVTLKDSSTSGGGNFYLSGMDAATVTGNVFDGQGVVLNGVTNATVSGNTFENIDATYTPGAIAAGDYEHPGLAFENAWGATGDANITVTDNTFDTIGVPNGAIAFENFTDGSGNEIAPTIGTLS